jgi:hypothetical protein
MRYWPNPAHKTRTSEAGPPAWSPDKDPCPSDMTVADRNALFLASVPVAPADPRARRFAIRRTTHGLEVYDVKWTRDVDDDPEFHAHPASRVPSVVLKAWRDDGTITQAEYGRLRKELPGC